MSQSGENHNRYRAHNHYERYCCRRQEADGRAKPVVERLRTPWLF